MVVQKSLAAMEALAHYKQLHFALEILKQISLQVLVLAGRWALRQLDKSVVVLQVVALVLLVQLVLGKQEQLAVAVLLQVLAQLQELLLELLLELQLPLVQVLLLELQLVVLALVQQAKQFVVVLPVVVLLVV
jgi:hypothetical protein